MTTKAFAYYRTSSATNVSKTKDGDESKKNGLREDRKTAARDKKSLCVLMLLRATSKLSTSSTTQL